MDRINVTKSFLPPIDEYESYVRTIWKVGQLTNQGKLLNEFEEKVARYLNIPRLQYVANGTLALQIAIKSLDIHHGDEIITTPFSYVATTSAILWEGAVPIYVDIDPKSFCIDPSKIEAAITNKTKAILAVHVFGNPCDVDEIARIATKHNLKVIYDAAHAFGVVYKGKSIFEYGDVSICSFHATKLFHTIEGGGVVTASSDLNKKIDLMKRFGHDGDNHIRLGINAKASEFNAAMGLCNLKYIDGIIDKRKKLTSLYNDMLSSKYQTLSLNEHSKYNYAYYPIVFKDETHLLKCMNSLNKRNIFPRRYFYPSLNNLPYIDDTQSCPISEDIANRIVCLPLYPELEEENVINICKIVNR